MNRSEQGGGGNEQMGVRRATLYRFLILTQAEQKGALTSDLGSNPDSATLFF